MACFVRMPPLGLSILFLGCTFYLLSVAADGGVARGEEPRTRSTETFVPVADLPPLLKFSDGAPVRTFEDWVRRKEEIRALIVRTFTGAFPKTVPRIVEATVLEDVKKPDGTSGRRVRLVFDTPTKVAFEVWIWMPKGRGPFPLLLTPPCTGDVSFRDLSLQDPLDDTRVGWAETALRRGYMVCLYPGADKAWADADYPGYEHVAQTFQREYPDATWAEIPARAWIASRTLDYLLDPRFGCPVADKQVGIIGWSRHGKQALIAAGFDERFTSVVSRSSSTPVPTPYRFGGRQTRMEATADTPDGWFLKSLKSFYGREHELPIDGHGFLALIAPRRCLIHEAHNDGNGSTFAAERAHREGEKIYGFLGKPDHLRLQYRTGQHGPITDEHRRRNIDWFDLSFGRGEATQDAFPQIFLHAFDWKAWKTRLGREDLRVPFGNAAFANTPRERKTRILWALGQSPATIPWDGHYTFYSDAESEMMGHDRWQVDDVRRIPVSFGENVRGNIYYNPTARAPLPAVIWLHPYSYHTGYVEGFGVQDYSSFHTGARGATVYHWLAQQGFLVLAFDQCGFGLRLLEGPDFYTKYPKWSRLGRMVRDVKSAVDFLVDGKGQCKSPRPDIDPRRVYVLGYSMGGMVGLYAAALDERIAGLASFSGFTPLRTDTDRKPTGGIRRLWEWHALQPLLGLFDSREGDVPYEYSDVLSLVAPRPCLIVAPKRDRDADHEDVCRCVRVAERAWEGDRGDRGLTFLTPDDINRFQAAQQEMLLEWLKTGSSD